jgi:hypothetical protein
MFWPYALRQLGGRQGLAHGIIDRICKLTQGVEQAQRMEHGGVNAHADAMVAIFDPSEGFAGRKSSVSHRFHREAPALTRIGHILPQLA